jgi:hypothetical protein
MSYEILLTGGEPIDDWTVCTVCLNVDRTAAVSAKKWRCSDCGSGTSNNLQQSIRTYLLENPPDVLESNLKQWGSVKGVRPAYKMLKSARYKCLLSLSRRKSGTPGTE